MKSLKKLSKKQLEWVRLMSKNEEEVKETLTKIKTGELEVMKAENKKEMDYYCMDYNLPYLFSDNIENYWK